MKIQLKRLEGTKWKRVNMEEITGTPINRFLLESEVPVMAAIFEDDSKEAILLICNEIEHLHRYKLEGKVCLNAETFGALMGTEDVSQKLIASIFPDSKFVERTHE